MTSENRHTPEITVVVATFGDTSWERLARRALDSARGQAPVVHVHGDTLAGARNACLDRVETEFVVHLDADDTLEPGYVDALAAGTADVRAPRVRAIRGGRQAGLFMPRVWRHRHACTADCLPAGNWIVVGAAARTELVRAAGGWWDEPIYEDWSLWLRCRQAGGTFEQLPAAIYRQHLRADSRNHAGDAWEHREDWHVRILESILDAPAPA